MEELGCGVNLLPRIFPASISPCEAGLAVADRDEQLVVCEALDDVEEEREVVSRDDVEVHEVGLGVQALRVAMIHHSFIERAFEDLDLGRILGPCAGHGGARHGL